MILWKEYNGVNSCIFILKVYFVSVLPSFLCLSKSTNAECCLHWQIRPESYLPVRASDEILNILDRVQTYWIWSMFSDIYKQNSYHKLIIVLTYLPNNTCYLVSRSDYHDWLWPTCCSGQSAFYVEKLKRE